MTHNHTLALPSKGAIAEPTYSFLKECGLKISKPNARQYTGSVPAITGMSVLFQRVKDVAYKVADGTAQLGITGLDVVLENPHEDVIVIHDALGYGHCQLVVAVPDAWLDAYSMLDLLDISLDMREKYNHHLRIATTYTHLTRQFLHKNGIHHFNIVKAEGAIEAAPTIGYADIIVDITQTGTTLRENHLRILEDGIITEAQTCLIGNRKAIKNDPQLREALRMMLERIDATLEGKLFSQVTVNMCGKDTNKIAAKIMQNAATQGLQGPTISPIFGDSSEKWFTVTLTLRTRDLIPAVNYLRSIGGTHIVTSPVHYIYRQESSTYNSLLEKLELS